MNHIERDIRFGKEGALSGSLLLPKLQRKAPAVLFISGSGNADRDGNLKNIRLNLYQDLAQWFASQGFASLRYDKPGVGKSEGNFMETGFWDLVDAAQEAFTALAGQPEIDASRVLIVGHSEGAFIAPVIASLVPGAGVILLAGCAQASRDVLPLQSRQVFTELRQAGGFKGFLFGTCKLADFAERQNEKTLQKILSSPTPVLRIKGAPVNAKWLQELFAFDVRPYVSQIPVPTLAITGSKDIQVPPEDVYTMKELNPEKVEAHIIAGMNHILRQYAGEHTMLGLIKEYKGMLQQPICDSLHAVISAWLQRFEKQGGDQ